MGPELIGLTGLVVLIALLCLRIPVAFVMILVGFIGAMKIVGPDVALKELGITAYNTANSYLFSVIPLFLLMSSFVERGGIGGEAYSMARAWVGHVRGGLAMATVGACALFAATSGSSMACAVALGKISYPEMRKAGYSAPLAGGCVAAGGTLGILIPPSIPFCVFGILMEVSIGKLFMAGILPGILVTLCYWVTIYIQCRLNPKLGPAGPNTTWKEKILSLRMTWPIILLFVIVMGGIYMGLFTPTEAGGIGAFGALAICVGRGKLSGKSFVNSLKDTMGTSTMLLMLLIGAYVFNYFIAVSRLPFVTSQFIQGLQVNGYVILGIILLFYLVLGCFLDVMSIIVLTLPIILPTIVALDFNLIWFGVLLVRVTEVGFITPPFGFNIFVLEGAIDIKLADLYRGIYPFVYSDLVNICLLVAFPIISTFLPSLMRRA
jgi:tripartite ATP-independent transporter DctM subunit